VTESVGIGFDLDADPAVESIRDLAQAAEQAAGSADKLAAAGERIARSSDAAALRTAAAAQETAKLNAQLNAVETSRATSSTTALAGAQEDLIARMDRLVQSSKSVDLANKNAAANLVSQAAGVRALAQGTGQLATVEERFQAILATLSQRVRDHAAAMTQATNGNRYLTREMALSQIEAQKMNEALDRGTAVHAKHAHGLNLIQTSLTSLVGHAVGVPPVVDHIASSLGILAVGAGTTLGITAGLAAIALGYEIITRRSEEAKKAAAAFRESEEGLSARSRAQEAERSLTGNKAFGTSLFGSIDIVGQTKAITEARRAFQGFQQELNSRESGNVGIQRFGLFNQNLLVLRKELASGSISLATFNHDLTALDAAFPGMEREILKTRELGESYDEAAKAVARLQAAETNRRAEGRSTIAAFGQPGTSFEAGGDAAVRLAESRKRLGEAQQDVATAKSGGGLAVQALHNEREAVEDATAKWKDYVVATGDAKLAEMSYTAARSSGNAVAQQFLTDAQAEITAREKTTRTVQLQAEVTRGTGEIEKQRALNAAFGESDRTVRELAIRYDALNQKRQAALTHEGAELAQVNAVTDAMAAQQIQAVELATAKQRREGVEDAQATADAAERAAAQEAALVGQSADEVARKRIQYKLTNDEIAIQIRLTRDLANAGHDEGEQAAARARADAARRAAVANAATAGATADVGADQTTQQMRLNREAIEAENAALASGAAQRKGYEIDLKAQLELKKAIATIHDPTLLQNRKDEIEATREAEQQHRVLSESIQKLEERAKQVGRGVGSAITSALDALSTKGANFFQAWWDAGKRGLNKFIGDAVGSLASDKFAGMMGLGTAGAATKQVTAGAMMLRAAEAQLQAAGLMMVQGGQWSTAVNGGVADASTVFNPVQSGGSGLQTGLGYGAIAAGGALTGYGVGSALYSTSHGAAGNYARGALGGAAAGALTGAAIGSVIPGIGTAVGAVVGGLTGLVGGILGVGSAAKEAKRHLAELQKDLETSMASLRAQVAHNDLAGSIAQADADREQRRRAIEEAYQGGGANSENVRRRNELLRENDALEDRYIAQLREEAAAKSQYFTEDLDVRALRAKGQAKQADDLEFQHQQQRELDEYRRTHDMTDAANQAQYAYLQQVIAMEANRRAIDAATGAMTDFTNAVRNAPQGFRIEPYIYAHQEPTPIGPDTAGLGIPGAPRFSMTGRANAVAPVVQEGATHVTFEAGSIVVNESQTPELTAERVADLAVAGLARKKARRNGMNATLTAALNRAGGTPS
jgi:hypothetical protein